MTTTNLDALFDAHAAATPTVPDGVTISARVPADLRARILDARLPGETASDAVRRLLELGLDRHAQARRLIENPGQGARRRRAGSTEANAALKVAPRVGTARHRALTYIAGRAGVGATTDDVVRALEPAPQNGTARRVTDLAQGALIEPVRPLDGPPAPIDHADGRPLAHAGAYGTRAVLPGEEVIRLPDGRPGIGRRTRTGTLAIVYAITTAGLTALASNPIPEAR